LELGVIKPSKIWDGAKGGIWGRRLKELWGSPKLGANLNFWGGGKARKLGNLNLTHNFRKERGVLNLFFNKVSRGKGIINPKFKNNFWPGLEWIGRV